MKNPAQTRQSLPDTVGHFKFGCLLISSRSKEEAGDCTGKTRGPRFTMRSPGGGVCLHRYRWKEELRFQALSVAEPIGEETAADRLHSRSVRPGKEARSGSKTRSRFSPLTCAPFHSRPSTNRQAPAELRDQLFPSTTSVTPTATSKTPTQRQRVTRSCRKTLAPSAPAI